MREFRLAKPGWTGDQTQDVAILQHGRHELVALDVPGRKRSCAWLRLRIGFHILVGIEGCIEVQLQFVVHGRALSLKKTFRR